MIGFFVRIFRSLLSFLGNGIGSGIWLYEKPFILEYYSLVNQTRFRSSLLRRVCSCEREHCLTALSDKKSHCVRASPCFPSNGFGMFITFRT